MPNRYIKESCTTSPTLAALSDAGERLFWRLTTVADDYGRFDANPAVLFGKCVPLLHWSVSKVEHAFSEMCKIVPGDECPLVLIYRVKGRLYGCLTNWKEHQRDRSKDANPPKPKFPGPEDGLIVPPQHAAHSGDLRQLAALNESESESEDDNENESDNVSVSPQVAAKRDECQEFFEAYPKAKRVGMKAVRKAWKQARDRPPIDDMLQALEQCKLSDQWTKDEGKFIPNSTTWLNQGRWDAPLPAKTLSTMEAFLAREMHDDRPAHAIDPRRLSPRVAPLDLAAVGEVIPLHPSPGERRTHTG